MQSGLRSGSIIYGDILKTSKREVALQDAIQTAQDLATLSTVPGTSVTPITAADVQVDKIMSKLKQNFETELGATLR